MDYPFKCPDCERPFPNKKGMSLHITRWCTGDRHSRPRQKQRADWEIRTKKVGKRRGQAVGPDSPAIEDQKEKLSIEDKKEMLPIEDKKDVMLALEDKQETMVLAHSDPLDAVPPELAEELDAVFAKLSDVLHVGWFGNKLDWKTVLQKSGFLPKRTSMKKRRMTSSADAAAPSRKKARKSGRKTEYGNTTEGAGQQPAELALVAVETKKDLHESGGDTMEIEVVVDQLLHALATETVGPCPPSEEKEETWEGLVKATHGMIPCPVEKKEPYDEGELSTLSTNAPSTADTTHTADELSSVVFSSEEKVHHTVEEGGMMMVAVSS